MTESCATTVVVGVVRNQPPAVVAAAAKLAEKIGAELICVWVDTARYTVGTSPDGAVIALPIDPDLVIDAETEVFDPELEDKIAAALQNSSVSWSVRALAGSAAHELARVAEDVDASLIVVGTREAGLRGSLREFFNGSVAVQLTHRQHRPVVVVPLNPVGTDGSLPWGDTGTSEDHTDT